MTTDNHSKLLNYNGKAEIIFNWKAEVYITEEQ